MTYQPKPGRIAKGGRAKTIAPPGYITPADLAKKCKMSMGFVYSKREECSAILSEDGGWIFPVTAIARLGQLKRASRSHKEEIFAAQSAEGTRAGRVEAAAIEMFDKGASILDVVREVKVTIAEARVLRNEYDDLAAKGVPRAAAAPEKAPSPYDVRAELTMTDDGNKMVRLAAFVDWGDSKETFVLSSEWYPVDSPEGRILEINRKAKP